MRGLQRRSKAVTSRVVERSGSRSRLEKRRWRMTQQAAVGNNSPPHPPCRHLHPGRGKGTALMQRVSMASATAGCLPCRWKPGVRGFGCTKLCDDRVTGCFLLSPARPVGESFPVNFDVVSSINRQRTMKQNPADALRQDICGSQSQQFIT